MRPRPQCLPGCVSVPGSHGGALRRGEGCHMGRDRTPGPGVADTARPDEGGRGTPGVPQHTGPRRARRGVWAAGRVRPGVPVAYEAEVDYVGHDSDEGPAVDGPRGPRHRPRVPQQLQELDARGDGHALGSLGGCARPTPWATRPSRPTPGPTYSSAAAYLCSSGPTTSPASIRECRRRRNLSRSQFIRSASRHRRRARVSSPSPASTPARL